MERSMGWGGELLSSFVIILNNNNTKNQVSHFVLLLFIDLAFFDAIVLAFYSVIAYFFFLLDFLRGGLWGNFCLFLCCWTLILGYIW